MINRNITSEIKELTKGYPIVTLTGPRQSGKSTLLTNTFPGYEYITLEDVDMRSRALDDPRGFLDIYSEKVIIDEAQYVPDLFSYIQTKVDSSSDTGMYILSGSQNFLLLKQIKQSLAGRAGIAKLLPLTYSEIKEDRDVSVAQFMFSGGYPRVYDKGLDPTKYYDNYVSTYLDRDIREVIGINNISEFNRFLTLCAARVGQLLNLSSLSNDAGVSVNTVKKWLNVLESSYIVKLVQPYHANVSKRLIKSPKLFFLDSGLLCYLLGIESEQEMLRSKYYGSIFENFCFSEYLKSYYNKGKNNPRLYFYRDSNGNEVDLIDEISVDHLRLCEIKASKTTKKEYGNTLNELSLLLTNDKVEKVVIYQGRRDTISDVHYVPVDEMNSITD